MQLAALLAIRVCVYHFRHGVIRFLEPMVVTGFTLKSSALFHSQPHCQLHNHRQCIPVMFSSVRFSEVPVRIFRSDDELQICPRCIVVSPTTITVWCIIDNCHRFLRS